MRAHAASGAGVNCCTLISNLSRTCECCQTRHTCNPLKLRSMLICQLLSRPNRGAIWIAMAGTALGWFALDSLVANFGVIRHTAHFYDLPAAIVDPLWLLRGISAHTLATVASSQSSVWRSSPPRRSLAPRVQWRPWGLFAPLTLMLLCSIAFYIRASSAHIEPNPGPGTVGGWISHHVANGAMTWSGDVVARHVVGRLRRLSISSSPSGWLAWQGIRELRTGRGRSRLAAR